LGSQESAKGVESLAQGCEGHLRHTAATRLRAKGCDARVIQKIIGWKNLSTMDKVYMGEDKARLLEAAL